MKKIFLSILFLGLIFTNLTAQDVGTQLNTASSAYGSGNLQETRFALQQALHEIDMAIGAEILKILPASLNNMPKEESGDNVSSVGLMGLMVGRKYSATDGSASASVDIITDSPMLAGINAILALPMIASDPNQKRIRVSSYRALLTRSDDGAGNLSWDVQVPMGSTLLTFNCQGPTDEKTVTDMVNSIKVDEILRLIR